MDTNQNEQKGKKWMRNRQDKVWKEQNKRLKWGEMTIKALKLQSEWRPSRDASLNVSSRASDVADRSFPRGSVNVKRHVWNVCKSVRWARVSHGKAAARSAQQWALLAGSAWKCRTSQPENQLSSSDDGLKVIDGRGAADVRPALDRSIRQAAIFSTAGGTWTDTRELDIVHTASIQMITIYQGSSTSFRSRTS